MHRDLETRIARQPELILGPLTLTRPLDGHGEMASSGRGRSHVQAGEPLDERTPDVRRALAAGPNSMSMLACKAAVKAGDPLEPLRPIPLAAPRNGVTSALLVQAGGTGVDDILSGADNFLEAFVPKNNAALLAAVLVVIGAMILYHGIDALTHHR